MIAIEAVTATGETAALCHSVGLARATLYRRRQPAQVSVPTPRAPSLRALVPAERQAVLDVLHSERFVDQSPAEVQATLLEEQTYLCSTRTMYRILDAAHEVRERRDQARHPAYAKPELVATAPNQIWSWDITKLKGPSTWNHFQLYVILDVYSRYVVGWMVEDRDNANLAEEFIAETIHKQRVDAGQLTIHADRGSSMTSKAVAFLLADLGVTKTHSRPHVSNDNPYSEAHFKTLKYRPEFPERFGSIQHARDFCRRFFDWYNREHRHSGIAMMTPVDVHCGRVDEVVARRAGVLDLAHRLHPERFVRGAPAEQRRPQPAWINPPARATEMVAAAAH